MVSTEFEELVYKFTRKIPRGSFTTYREIARAIGRPRAYRAVGNALNKNPHPLLVPCHRVVRSDFHVGGFSRSIVEKIKLLKSEGVNIEGNYVRGEPFKLNS